MIDHVAYPVSDYDRGLKFYLSALAPLNYKLQAEFEHEGTKIAGLGEEGGKADLWIWQGRRESPRCGQTASDACHSAKTSS